jgi:hypothetical protein
MAWKGIVNRGFTLPEFRLYLQTLEFRNWKPSFMVLHNTAAPTLKQWNSYPEAQRILNLQSYYKDLGWSSGPHAFIDNNTIWLFTPLTTPGTHTPSWNGTALGIELVGDYAREDADRGDGYDAKMLCVAFFGELHKKLGLNPETIRLHKEDPRTTHDCPGGDIRKEDFIRLVQEYMGEAGEHPRNALPVEVAPHPPPSKEGTVAASVGALGLNLREQASSSSKVLRSLPSGTKVAILGEAMNGATRWYRVWCRVEGDPNAGWVSARYVT